MSTIDFGEGVRPDGETLAWLGLVLTTEFLLVVGYVFVFDVLVRDWTLFVVPFVWLNVAGWAVYHTRPAPASAGKRRVAANHCRPVGIGAAVNHMLFVGVYTSSVRPKLLPLSCPPTTYNAPPMLAAAKLFRPVGIGATVDQLLVIREYTSNLLP